MLNCRRPATVVFLFFSIAVVLGGCRGFTARMGKPDRGMTFRSPLPPVKVKAASAEDIRKVLTQRSQPVRGLKARVEITVGEGGRRNPRQRFDAFAYVDPPDFLRVRAQQGGTTVFDVLVDGHNATAVIVPERLVLRGSTVELNRSPQATLGIAPALLFEAINVEAALAGRLQRQQCEISMGAEKIILWFANGNVAEEFVLRRQDLLVERLTQWRGRRKMGEVRFWAYENYPSWGCVASEFVIENAAGGAALFRLTDVRLGEERTPQLVAMEIPEGFEVKPLIEGMR